MDSKEKDAPESVRHDWKTISTWLGGCENGIEITKNEKIQKAWKAYLSIGVAPSLGLQHLFDSYSNASGSSNYPRPPQEILAVFDRLIATDEEISEKRHSDAKQEKDHLKKIFLKEDTRSWWRRRSALFRNWTFASITWMILFFIYELFFDPFDRGGWGLSDTEFTQYIIILLTPFGAGIVYYTYQKWVV